MWQVAGVKECATLAVSHFAACGATEEIPQLETATVSVYILLAPHFSNTHTETDIRARTPLYFEINPSKQIFMLLCIFNLYPSY